MAPPYKTGPIAEAEAERQGLIQQYANLKAAVGA